MRQLVDENGMITLAQTYQPYGETLSSTSDGGATNYAFAGEWRDASGLDYLRARYYASWQGRFITKDVWPGDYSRPLTLNKWNYVVGNPVNLTDPTGRFPEYCKVYPNRMAYEDCVRNTYHVQRPWRYEIYLASRMNSKDCLYEGPIPYRTIGYIEGVSSLHATYSAGYEVVYDFATMQRASFTYDGLGVTTGLGIGYTLYAGIVGFVFPGFNSNSYKDEIGYKGIVEYEGPFASMNVGIQANAIPGIVGISGGVMAFASPTLSPPIGGVAFYVGASAGLDLQPIPIGPDLAGGFVEYKLYSGPQSYVRPDSSGFIRVQRGELIQALSAGPYTPRWLIYGSLLNLIEAYEGLYNAGK